MRLFESTGARCDSRWRGLQDNSSVESTDLALSCTLNHLVWHRIASKSMNARLDTDSITTHNSTQVRMRLARGRRGRPAASRWLYPMGFVRSLLTSFDAVAEL
jgi:hypothetical protein